MAHLEAEAAHLEVDRLHRSEAVAAAVVDHHEASAATEDVEAAVAEVVEVAQDENAELYVAFELININLWKYIKVFFI